MESVERAVEQDCPFVPPVIQQHLKRSAGRHKELMAPLMRMGSAALPTWDIVSIENSLYLKREVYAVVDVRQIAGGKRNLRQLYE